MKKSEFEWIAEESDDRLDEALSGKKQHNAIWRRTGVWIFLFFVMALLVFYVSLERKQTALENNEKQSIEAAFKLWREAVLNKDEELFNLALVKENRPWINAQQRLFDRNMILYREPVGLQIEEEGLLHSQIELSPDLGKALLTFEQVYSTDRSEDDQKITLRHSLTTQKKGGGWQFSPMEEDFWGEWIGEKGEFLHIEFKERDAEISRQLSQDLNQKLRSECLQAERNNNLEIKCNDFEPFTLVLSTDPLSMQGFMHPAASLLEEKTILLPTPTLLGLPVDEEAYEFVLQAYAEVVTSHYEPLFYLPIALPNESVYTLCFNFPKEGLRLFRYDLVEDSWTAEMADRAFYSLRALPDDKGIILQVANSADDTGGLRLLRFQDQRENHLIDITFGGSSYRPIGWAEADAVPRLLLQSNAGQPEVSYGWIDVQSCSEGGCEIIETTGYPTWSPDGKQSLIVEGSDIFLGDDFGQPNTFVGSGFNPFWIDSDSYGFIRFNENDGQMITELVVRHFDQREFNVLLDGKDLAKLAGEREENNVFIQYATISPVNPKFLILTASGVRRLAGEHFVFTYQLGGDDEQEEPLRLLMRHQGTPGGTPASLTPTGFPPIDVSPDGRWLLLSELSGSSRNRWSYYFLYLEESQPPRVTESFPVLPAQFPFYDWSKDGRWLVIADYGFFRLIAPEYEYERLIPHNFDSCGFTVWSE